MKPETLINHVGQLERRRDVVDLLDAAEGMLSQHKAALVSRILREVVAGRIHSGRGDRNFNSREAL
ncbi:MAG: hypothetical protein KF682_04690 [Nitrospira sp.]|nr:hypothetical protein [Nitrospira sp.]